jgi:predicted O-methyltransferase YrrM
MSAVKAFLKYRKNAVNAHGIHSPFVFEFYNDVLKKVNTVDDINILALKRKLESSSEKLSVTDLGVGSKSDNGTVRRVSKIAKQAGVNRKYGRLLSRIVSYYGCKMGVELGTSLGFGTAYLAQNGCMERLITIEGCPNIHAMAVQNHAALGLNNIEHFNGEFSTVLPTVLDDLGSIDIAYVDGNHGYEPTIKYFEMLVEKAHSNSFIIFDDINWSEDMRRAWEEICRSKKINLSMEFFRMGIVAKREEQVKQHFTIKF